MKRIIIAAATVVALAAPALAQSTAPAAAVTGVANQAPTTLAARKDGPTASPAAQEQPISAAPVGGSEPVARSGQVTTQTKKPQ